MIVRELELDLDAFEGPFDLLLTLVLKEELDLAEVDVAGIVVRFVERLAGERDRFFRIGPAPLAPQPERRLAPQDPAKLGEVLRLLAAPPATVSLAHMELRFPPVAQFVERFRALLTRRSVVDFDQEVGGLTRVEQAVAFLALLELRRANQITISQAAPFAPIRIARAEETAAANERTPAWIVHSA